MEFTLTGWEIGYNVYLSKQRSRSIVERHTPAWPPKKLPSHESGAEIPNQRTTTKSIVPKGTAPDEPATMRKKFSKKTIANIMVGSAVAVTNAILRRSVPPIDA